MTHESLALKLRVLRAERALTIEQAARQAGVTPETISDAERGRRRPYLPTLRKVAAAYGVPVEELLAEEAQEPALAVKAEASEAEAAREALKRSPLAQVTLDATHIRSWLTQQRATHALMSDEDFENEVITSDPSALLRTLEREREQLREELRKPETRTTLFPNNVSAQVTKDARIAEAMRPYRQISRLRILVEREYTRMTRILENYIEHLSLLEAQSDEERREAFREEAALVGA